MLVGFLGSLLHFRLSSLDSIGAEPVSLALVHLFQQAIELRSDVEAVESANGGVDVVDEEAVDAFDAMDDTRVDLVHVEGVGDGRRVQAVLVSLIDVGRDVALVNVVVRLGSLVNSVNVRLNVAFVILLSVEKVRVELLSCVFESTTTSRVDALVPDETSTLAGLAIDGPRDLLSTFEPGSCCMDHRTSVRLCLLLSEIEVRLDDRCELVMSLSQVAADGASILCRIVESEGT